MSANRWIVLKNRFQITAHSSTTSSVTYAGLLVYTLTINLTLTLSQLRLLLAACILANLRAAEVLKHNLQVLARVTEDSSALPLPLKLGRLFPLLKRAMPLFLSRTQRVTSQLVRILLLAPKLFQTQFLFWGTATRSTLGWEAPT